MRRLRARIGALPWGRWEASLPWLAGGVGALHVVLLSEFTVDDAAISYAYAAGIAKGLGAGIAVAGEPIADAYSNASWTFLISFIETVGVDAETGGAWLGVLLGALGATLTVLLARELVRSRAATWVALLGGLCSFWALWGASGLENPLMGSGMVVLALALTRLGGNGSWRWAVAAGLAGALVALTRPEGFIYASLGVVVAALVVEARGGWRSRLQAAAIVAISAAAVVVPYYLWHRHRFATWLPNPVAAKSADSPLDALRTAITEPGEAGWRNLMRDLVKSGWVLLGPLALAAVLQWRRQLLPVSTLLVASLALPVLEPDWMPDGRFLTAAVLLLAAMAAAGAETVWHRFPTPGVKLCVVGAVAFAGAVSVVNSAVLRGEGFASHVTVESVAARYAPLVDDARAFGLVDPLYMLPDIGGSLRVLDMRILDSAGLGDTQIAHSDWDVGALHRYAFDERRPELVHTHGEWSEEWDIESEQVMRDLGYLTLRWVAADGNGDFVRRDVLIRPAGASLPDDGVSRVDAPTAASPGGTIAVDLYWAAIDDGARQRLDLRNQASELVASSEVELGYGIVDDAELGSSEVLRQHQRLLVPAELEAGTYVLHVSSGAFVRELTVEVGADVSPEDTVSTLGELQRVRLAMGETVTAGMDAETRAQRAAEALAAVMDPQASCRRARDASAGLASWRGRQQPSAAHRRAAAELSRRSGYDCLLAASRLDPTRADVLLELTARRLR